MHNGVRPHPDDRGLFGGSHHVESHHRLPEVRGATHLVKGRSLAPRAPDPVQVGHLVAKPFIAQRHATVGANAAVFSKGKGDWDRCASIGLKTIEEVGTPQSTCGPPGDRTACR